jgi:predicted O-methyltransferase YrrM
MKKKGSIFIPELEEYMNSHLVIRPCEILTEIEEYATKNSIPVLSPNSGDVLSRIVEWNEPTSILELGTGAGASLFWMVSRSKRSLNILTVDRNRELLPMVEALWEKSEYKNQHSVQFQSGFIVEQLQDHTIHSLDFDFVFIDCDKVTYPDILDHLIREFESQSPNEDQENRGRVRQILLFDNVFWHGRILNPDPKKPSDLALKKFWEIIETLPYSRTVFPSGDGLLFLELERGRIN